MMRLNNAFSFSHILHLFLLFLCPSISLYCKRRLGWVGTSHQTTGAWWGCALSGADMSSIYIILVLMNCILHMWRVRLNAHLFFLVRVQIFLSLLASWTSNDADYLRKAALVQLIRRLMKNFWFCGGWLTYKPNSMKISLSSGFWASNALDM